MTRRTFALGLLLLLLAAAHCGGQVSTTSSKDAGPDSSPRSPDRDSTTGYLDGPAPHGDAGSSCTRDSDCSGGTRCAFAAARACGWNGQRCKTGTCTVPLPPSTCGAITTVTACACDGTPVSFLGGCGAVFSEGLAPVPFAYLGPCEAGAPCTSTADCGPQETCGYEAGAGCAAKGQCVSSSACNCDNLCCSSTSAPACDGSVAEVDCRGYASKPVCLSNCE